jgi:hypothetical protein
MKCFQNTTIAIVFAILPVQASATPVSGHVADAKTGEAIIGASIIYNNKVGAVTDADGDFHLDIATFPSQISVSYVGYENQRMDVRPSKAPQGGAMASPTKTAASRPQARPTPPSATRWTPS